MPGRGQQRPRDELAAVGERETLVAAVDRDAGDFERREELGAEPLRLRQGAARQLAAADAGRKPEIVLDPRAACPPVRPGACRSSSSVRSPSDAPYTAAARPAGPAPTITRS